MVSRRCRVYFAVFISSSVLVYVVIVRQFLFVNMKISVNRHVDCILPGTDSVNGTVNYTRLRQISRTHDKIGKDNFVILIYTTHFFHNVWPGVGYVLLPEYTKHKKCIFQNCDVTYNKDHLVAADAVIFHGVDLQGPDQFSSECLNRLSMFRPGYQRWIYFMHESPVYTWDLKKYNGLFNWTMTYMRRSDIFVPYFHYRELLPREPRPKADHNYAKGKTGLILWIVSHCGLLRDEYVKELQNYVDVTVYGGCGSLFRHNGGHCSQWVSECDRMIRQYKFYLAFENCFCEDYVTEKYWDKGLLHETIPIVMGAVYNPSVVIPGSYIDVNDFNSIRELADHIKFLDTNDEAFNKYFQWRQKYQVVRGYDFLCQTCEALNTYKRESVSVYHDLSSYWSKEGACQKYGERIQKIHEQIGFSRYG